MTTIQKVEFETSAPTFRECPDCDLPEFAFIGRSNVGKSSLINRISGRPGLAKVSPTPGHTKTLNFFNVDGLWSLVDLPGYGYAQKDAAARDRFERLIVDYLEHRESLAQAFVLIDSRHPPQAIDQEFVRWMLQVGVPFSLVFTKIDRVKPAELERHVELFAKTFEELGLSPVRTFRTSSETGAGRFDLLKFIGETIREWEG
jgi:GTP-binding protein